MSKVHEKSITGFNKSNVEAYNIGRPAYNEETVLKVVDIVSNSLSAADIPSFVELGAGTGKFTASFFQHDQTIDKSNYLATDPSSDFLDSLKDLNLNVQVNCNDSCQIPSPDDSVSAVFVAQAFHWMANNETLNEIHRVLKKQAPLILIWNSMDRSKPWLQDAEMKLLGRYYTDDVPRYITGRWKDCFDNELAKELFTPLSSWQGRSQSVVTEEQAINRFMSVSVISSLNEEEKERFRSDLIDILHSHSNVPRTNDGRYILDYSHDIYWVYKR